MATITGKRSSGNILQANRWNDIAPVIYNLWPSETPFLTFLNSLKKTRTYDPTFKWFGKQPRADRDAVNNGGGYNSSATSIVVDDGSKFLGGDLVRVVDVTTGAPGEMFQVSSVSSNTLTVVRGVGSTSAAAMNDNDVLEILGDAQSEGSSLPTGNSQLAVERYNYTQIMRTTTTYTRTLMESKLQVDKDEVTRRREEKSREHKRKIEKTLLYGERGGSGLTGESPNRKTGGLYYWIQNAISVDGIDNTQSQSGGTLTEAQLEEFLETKAFAYGSTNKLALCSRRFVSVLNNLTRGRIEVMNKATEYGINLVEWTSPHGTLKLAVDRVMDFGIFQYAAFIVDLEQIKTRYIGDSEMRFKPDQGVTGDDQKTDEWLSELGLEVGVPATCAFISNVHNAA